MELTLEQFTMQHTLDLEATLENQILTIMNNGEVKLEMVAEDLEAIIQTVLTEPVAILDQILDQEVRDQMMMINGEVKLVMDVEDLEVITQMVAQEILEVHLEQETLDHNIATANMEVKLVMVAEELEETIQMVVPEILDQVQDQILDQEEILVQQVAEDYNVLMPILDVVLANQEVKPVTVAEV